MPPEPLPWDRKDFFKERKHDRSEQHHHPHPHPHPHPHQIGGGGGAFGGVGGFGGGPRWREPLHPHPHPYHYASHRWVSSDFRYRPPHGYGKQGGRHLYPEENTHAFMPSRPSDKILDDESCRASASGKYSRNSRESRGSFGPKDWKGHSWEAAPSPNGPGRPTDVSDQQRSVDEMLICNSSNPHSDSVNSWDLPQSNDQHEKNAGVTATASSGLRFEKENSLGSWKPLNKWNRSGSLSSRGSGFSYSSSSKSMGADSAEVKVEVQPSSITPTHSPSLDTTAPAAVSAAACETYTAASEETNSRKKPRLGWGEGLAKYEKKKVGGVDDRATGKNGMIICSSNREHINLLPSSLADKSPRVAGFSDCCSPATPSSVGCSSSPGIEEKHSIKAGNVEHDTTQSSVSPGVVSHNHIQGSSFNLENLDLAPITSLNCAINELLQVDDTSSLDSGFVKSTAINKLLVWKGDVLKALEMTESEIDKLEGELKLISEPQSSCLRPATSSSLAMDCNLKPSDDQDAASDITPGQSPLELVCSGGNDVPKLHNAMEVDNAEAKDEDVYSPATATSKSVEGSLSGRDVSPTQLESHVDCVSKIQIRKSENIEVNSSTCDLKEDKGVEVPATHDGSLVVVSSSLPDGGDVNLPNCEVKLCETILASNKETAKEAAEIFNHLLPTNGCSFDISNTSGVSCLENYPLIKERLLRRKLFLQFKERVISLKFMALQHLWKDDIRSLSIRKFRVKSQKKLDLSLRTVNGGHQKHRLSIRRSSSSAGNLSFIPTPETISFISKLVSDSQLKPMRNTLKMPALILDEKEKVVSRFISTNGLVEDPCAVEKERSMINPWTAEEKEIFMDKLAAYGKDFRKIASFLVHKTTADCIEFYYKNHKSDCFRQTKRQSGFVKQRKGQCANNYLVASGKRWNREANAASLDILGAASAMAANIEVGMEIQQRSTSKILHGLPSNCKTSRGDAVVLERSSSIDLEHTDRETVAADVLAGICGSLSSEAMGSCITSAVDPGEGYHERKCQRIGSANRWPLTPEVTQNIDDETCSDESCGEMDPNDWTDMEKSIFLQAVSSYGKDFDMISRCVRTKSRDQCSVFFSKARKRLGLDVLCPGSGNISGNGANGTESDTDDTCMVETVSIIGSEKSVVRMEDLPSPDVKLNTEPDTAGRETATPDTNRLEMSNGTGDLEPVDSQHQLMDKTDDSLLEENRAQDLDGDVHMLTGAAMQDDRTAIVPGTGVVNSGEVNHNPDGSDIQTEFRTSDEVAELQIRRTESRCLEQEVLPEIGMDANHSNASATVEVMKSGPDIHDSGSHHTDADRGSSSGCDGVSAYKQQADLESDSAQKPYAIPFPQNKYPVPLNLAPHISIAVSGCKSLQGNKSPVLIVGNSGQEGPQASKLKQHLSRDPILGSVESSDILSDQPAAVLMTEEVSGGGSHRRSAVVQSISKLDRNFPADRQSTREAYLPKCNGVKQHTSVGELSFQSQEQITDNCRSSSSSEVEKPRQNGDVKLFGQILTKPSSQQKASSSIQENRNSENQHCKGGKSFNVKFPSDQSVDGNSAQRKVEHGNFLSSENLPVKSYGFWDGSRIQTGFSSLPDSALLLAKYPAAFSSYAVPSSRMDQLPLHGVNNGGECSLKGPPSFQARDIGGSSNGGDYQVYRNREMQPFALDMKQRQDMLISEMQRRNGYDVVSGMQQQARGIVGMNVVGRGGVLLGGQCTGVSDPVAAIKMHYAQTEQFNGQTGSMIREDDPWRGKGNIGR